MTPFEQGLAEGRLVLPRCTACGRRHAPARLACPHCGSVDLTWEAVDPTGRVEAVTVVHRAPDSSFRELVPYTLAVVEMDAGVRLMGHAEPDITVGARVRATTVTRQGVPLLRFVAG